jgi:hypothetical protein
MIPTNYGAIQKEVFKYISQVVGSYKKLNNMCEILYDKDDNMILKMDGKNIISLFAVFFL